MTRSEAEKALEEARRVKPEVLKTVYTPAYFDAQKRYLWDALDARGEGLAGMWTDLADEVFALVAYGVLTKTNWTGYFSTRQMEFGQKSWNNSEGAFRSRDPSQINTCRNGLANLIAMIPN